MSADSPMTEKGRVPSRCLSVSPARGCQCDQDAGHPSDHTYGTRRWSADEGRSLSSTEEAAMSGDSHSARARYEDVSSRAEAALTSGDPAKRQAWLDAMTQAEKELHAARHGPSWESLLADPTSQPFGADEVAASVRAYEDAPLASACACGGSMHKRCKP